MPVDPQHAWVTIFETMGRSMGSWVNRDRLRQAADDLTEALGYAKWEDVDSPLPERTGPEAPLVNAIQRLLEFKPENGYGEGFTTFVAGTDWADDKDPEVQAEALNDRPAWAAKLAGKPTHEVVTGTRTGRPIRKRLVPDTGAVPLLSQAAYYPILGKEDGRTLNAYIREVRRLAGLEDT